MIQSNCLGKKINNILWSKTLSLFFQVNFMEKSAKNTQKQSNSLVYSSTCVKFILINYWFSLFFRTNFKLEGTETKTKQNITLLYICLLLYKSTCV